MQCGPGRGREANWKVLIYPTGPRRCRQGRAMMLVCRVEPLLGDSDRARGGGLDGFGSGSRCLYVRVRNGNAVSMQGRTSQRQTGRSGLAATLIWACRWPGRVSLCVGLGTERGPRAHTYISCMYKRKCLCLALGLPMISFYARPGHTVQSAQMVFLQVGTASGWSVVGCRVQRGKRVF